MVQSNPYRTSSRSSTTAAWIACVYSLSAGLALSAGRARASEPGCYANPNAAATRSGSSGTDGYRLEALRRDAFSGDLWASVRNCTHPEWPSRMVLALASPGAAPSEPNLGGAALRVIGGSRRAMPLVLPGSLVRLVETRDNVRIESSGIAQSVGSAGDRIRVRLIPLSAPAGDQAGTSWSAGERFVTAIVRSSQLVEVDTR